ncbi:MAG: thiol reductant ABC exporter subunit CydD [Acidimicrobiales bacterium]
MSARATERPSALLGRLRRSSPFVTRALVLAVVLGLVSTAAIIGQAVTLATMLGALFARSNAGLAHEAGLFALWSLVRVLAVALGTPMTQRIAAPLRRDLRGRALQRVLDAGPLRSVDATVQLCTRGIDAIESYVSTYVPSLVLATLAPMVLVAWLALHDVLSGVIVLVSVLLLPVFMVLLGLEAKEKMEQRWREQQSLAGYFGDVVRGMTVLKSFNRSKDAVANLDDVGAALQRTTMGTLRVAFLSSFALELLSSLATALVALVLGLRLLNGSLSLTTALVVLLLTPEVFLPLRRSSAQFHASASGIAAATELLDYLEPVVQRASNPAPTQPPSLELREVTIVNSSRCHVGESAVSAYVPARSLVSVTGPSGSGKSTLLRALCGLGEVGGGEILVDGAPLGSIERRAWQRRVAWMPQDPTLPGDTVRDAVTMGDGSIDDHRIRRAMIEVDLDLDLDRALGEGSSELSAGQRRRLALVRCLVRDPLVLVLDEPLAHLDSESAALVEAAIDRLTMTRVVATHRPLHADQTITLTSAQVTSA